VERITAVGAGEVLWDLLPSGARLGGAPANFAFHAAQLGARAFLLSRLGDDKLGRRVRRIWARASIDDRYVQTDELRATGTVDVELRGSIPHYVIGREAAWDFIEWRPELQELAACADVVCFGTLAQRADTSCETIQRFVAAAPSSAMRIFDVNLRRGFYSAEVVDRSLRRANVLKLNARELILIAGLLDVRATGRGVERRSAIALALLARYGLEAIAVTRGALGSELFTREQVIVNRAPKIRVADTIGAGDAFAAALAIGYRRSGDWRVAADLANRCGAYVASRRGATPRLPESMKRV
jgi:fructokinase